ncbi:hypothetical protein ACOSQ4_006908 [Xanthoceras sorbifolium]
MLGDHRAKTFLQLLEFIRRMIMERFQKRKEECLGWKTEIPPSISKNILIASKDSRILRILSAGNGEYELLDETRAYVVKINEATCKCGGWQVSGIPCCHAMAAIGHYAGRDGVTRRIVERREPDEKPNEGRSGSVVCKKCGQPGHNRRTCRNESVFGKKKQNSNSNTAPITSDALVDGRHGQRNRTGGSGSGTAVGTSRENLIGRFPLALQYLAHCFIVLGCFHK